MNFNQNEERCFFNSKNDIKNSRRFYTCDKAGPKIYEEYDYQSFPDVFLQENPKEFNYGFIINNIRENKKTAEYFNYPCCVYLDIDFKDYIKTNILINTSEQIKSKFLSDVGCDSLEGFIEKLKSDPYVYIAGLSKSRNGLRFIFFVENDYLQSITAAPRSEERQLLLDIHRSNFEFVCEYLHNQYGYDNSKSNDLLLGGYNDTHAATITQMTFAIPKDAYVNLDCDVLYNEKCVLRTHNIIDVDVVSTITTAQFIQTLKESYGEIKKMFAHYDFTLLASIKEQLMRGNIKIVELCLEIYKRNYGGTGLTPYLSDYNTFVRYLQTSIKGKYAVPIETLLMREGIYVNMGEIGADFLGTQYDFTFDVDKYICEDGNSTYVEILNIIKNSDVLIKGTPGIGKTTFFEKLITENPDKKFLIIGSKNSLLEKIKGDFPSDVMDTLFINYGKDKDKIINYQNVFFSSIQSLWKLDKIDFDYVIGDEAHLLVDFVDLNKDNRYNEYTILLNIMNNSNIRKILFSATPEYFAISKPIFKFKYINIISKGYKKKKAKLIINKRPKEQLMLKYNELVGTMPVDIFYNDKDILSQIQSELSGGTLFTTDTQNSVEVKNIIDSEILPNDTTILFTTYGGEGLNFNNKERRALLIYLKTTDDIKDIYQFVNRYRNNNVDVYFFTSLFSFTEKMRDDKGNILLINGKPKYVSFDDKKPIFDVDEMMRRYDILKQEIKRDADEKKHYNKITIYGKYNIFHNLLDYKTSYLEYLNRTDSGTKLGHFLQYFYIDRQFDRVEGKGEMTINRKKDLKTEHLQQLFLKYEGLYKDEKFIPFDIFNVEMVGLVEINNIMEEYKKYKKEIKYILENRKKMLELGDSSNTHIFKEPQVFNRFYYGELLKKEIESGSNRKTTKGYKITDEKNIPIFAFTYQTIISELKNYVENIPAEKKVKEIPVEYVDELVKKSGKFNEKERKFIYSILKDIVCEKVVRHRQNKAVKKYWCAKTTTALL